MVAVNGPALQPDSREDVSPKCHFESAFEPTVKLIGATIFDGLVVRTHSVPGPPRACSLAASASGIHEGKYRGAAATEKNVCHRTRKQRPMTSTDARTNQSRSLNIYRNVRNVNKKTGRQKTPQLPDCAGGPRTPPKNHPKSTLDNKDSFREVARNRRKNA